MSARKLEEDENASGQFVVLCQAMRDLHDKLLAIDYSKDFVSQYKCPPVNEYFFCKSSNQAQQFFAFCCLSSYLVNRLSTKADFKVDSFDDPNLTIDRILNAAQTHVDISSFANIRAKFKQGYGPEVIGLLTRLADKVCLLKLSAEPRQEVKARFVDGDGSVLDEGEQDEDEVDAEDNEIELEEEFADYIIVEDGNLEEDQWEDESSAEPKKAMLESHQDLTEWKLELERILPQLNARFVGQSLQRSGAYDSEWRLHYKAALAQRATIDSVYGVTGTMLGALGGDIRQALDKIDAKEQYLRQNSSTILAEWTTVRERAQKLRGSFDAVSGETGAKADRLAQLSEEDRATKQSIEEYSLRMTDASPLAEAKKARDALRQELIKVNLQVGVAIQTLVRHISLRSSVY